ncbi:COG4315 family predicted lipoprotein [Streptomyces xantholiticus]|uniref:COG4315 family predicted lipoprotein n=1 Tax=Streptomyces xantholiticus TaxID=68285 RepID=UPI0016769387|nr:hypothetical protein [Streptomyces xantholiticus]
MFHRRAAMLAALTATGVLLLSACGGDAGSDGATGEKAPAAASSSGAIELAFKRGTAQENNAQQNTGDWAKDAAPAAATKKPVVRKWVQLSAGRAGTLNPVVVNGAGFTLYRFDNDSANPSKSTCEGECAATWPPYLIAPGGRIFVDGVKPSAIGVIKRTDGNFQVTIGGWPVYLFSKDLKAGDTNGQGVGGTWFGVTPDGQRAGRPTEAEPGNQPSSGASSEVRPASSVILFDAPGFSESGASRGIAGPGCQNVGRGSTFGSLSANGSVKIWEEADCKGRSATVEGNVSNLADIGFTTIRSIRFAG